jgi:hypothetical protein
MKDSFDECDLLFEPLPDAISDRPHLIAARLRERIAVRTRQFVCMARVACPAS